jgi:hypothetical protein
VPRSQRVRSFCRGGCRDCRSSEPPQVRARDTARTARTRPRNPAAYGRVVRACRCE